MAGGRSTMHTKLYAGNPLTQLCRIKTYPQLGGEPEQVETTDLEDTMQTFVPGVQSVDAMTFTSNYTLEEFQSVQSSSDIEQEYALSFGINGVDGIFVWRGQHSVYASDGDVNGVREMVITITPATGVALGTPDILTRIVKGVVEKIEEKEASELEETED